jgi:Flp pilus assembly protein TadD
MAGACAAFLLSLSAASPQWYRFQAGAWELVTDAGQRRGESALRLAAETAELLRQAAPELAPAAGAAATPPQIVLFGSDRDFAPFRRGQGHRGLMVSGGERSRMIVADSGGETPRILRHELVHWLLRRRRAAPPPWLEEGLAEYYSTLEFDGRALRLGRAPQGYRERLARSPWFEPAQLSAGGPQPEGEAAATFYAQSWAVVRWMMLEGGGAARMAALLALLETGRSVDGAFQETYGIALGEAMEKAKQMNVRLPADAAPDIRPVPSAPAVPAPAREPLPPPLPDIVRAECLLADGKESQSLQLSQEILRKHPESGPAHTLAGMLALRRADYAAAREHLERAIAYGDGSARTQFEYAMLVRDTGGPDALVEQSLRRAVAAAPEYAEAWLVLGNWLLAKGRAAEAAECLTRAAALEPQRSPAWEALGRALLAAGERARAREAALRAALTAATAEQGEMARALAREIESRPATPPPPAPAVKTPAGWQPREGDARVEGRLVAIDCETQRLRFRIEVRPRTARTPAEVVVLETDKPQLVMLRGKTAGRREFVCGPQQPPPEVAAGYVKAAAPAPAPGPAAAEAKEVKPEPPPAPPKREAAKSAKKAPAKKAPVRARPAPPKPEPAAGELVWLEFR